MNREELIKKWLDYNLNSEEQKAFEGLKDYDALVKLSSSAEGFKASDFDTEIEYKKLSGKIKAKRKTNWLQPLLKLAAVLVIGFSVFHFTNNLDTTIETLIAEQTNVTLPDASSVALNAQSSLAYNKNSWSDNREVLLEGEAYFKVAKGSKFEVKTLSGNIQVLGTQFNVKQRSNYFEVTCFEGLVAVNYNSESLKLKPGERFLVIDGKIINSNESKPQPSWLTNESSFTSLPIKYVLAELKRQYDINIDSKNIDVNQIFTGSFTHQDLELALKSITLPLGITYTTNNGTVVLKGE